MRVQKQDDFKDKVFFFEDDLEHFEARRLICTHTRMSTRTHGLFFPCLLRANQVQRESSDKWAALMINH